MNRHFLIVALLISVASCKKNKHQSPAKVITSFVLRSASNPGFTKDVTAIIINDSIILALPEAVPVTSLTPTIEHTGKSVTPGSTVKRDFTNPVRYSVTAADGSTRAYVAVVRRLSSMKQILSFAFRRSANQGSLTDDVDGVIDGDTIRITVNAVSVSGLAPAITHNGASISPSNDAGANFMNPVDYLVTAEDGSTKKYTVIVRSSISLFTGGHDGYLYAFDAATGKLKWRYRMRVRTLANPTYAAGTVFIGDSYYLLALDAATGKLKWETFLSGGASTSPQIVNNIVYIGVDNINGSSQESALIAVDALIGIIRWKQPLSGGFIRCNPTVAEGRVVTAAFAGDLLCFDAINGAQMWSFDAGIIRDNPAIVNGVVYIGSEFYKMVAIDLSNGRLKWEIRTVMNDPRSHGVGSSPTLHNGILYNGGGGALSAYDTATGALKWRYALVNGGMSNPVGEKGVIFASHLDNVYAISDGSLKWHRGTVASTNVTVEPSSATVAHGVVFTGSGYNNKIVAFSAASGHLIWEYEGSAPFTSGPCIVDGNGNSFHSAVSGAQQ